MAGMPRPHVTLIAAVARNGAIGKNNELLWRLPDDLQHFKRMTLGSSILMGRKTWDSIGRPLPGRRNIVISRNPEWRAAGAERAQSLSAALALLHDQQRAFVVGGAEIYAQALPLADALELTEIDMDADADTFFPQWDRTAFVVRSSEPHSEQGIDYRWVSYQRILGA